MKQKKKNVKKRRIEGERTYRPSVGREGIAHDIRITGTTCSHAKPSEP